ncbi:MAG: hypothetical protein QOI57_2747 [Rubrobacteraceae bacterium]|nr:hypothetical protein [Rubrobacteraceae bacterium]
MSRTALIMVLLVTAGLFMVGCGQQEQGQDTETTEETTAEETIAEETIVEETTAGETIVEETTRQETTAAAASDSEQMAEVKVEAAPPAQAALPPPSNGESHYPDGHMPSQELGVNEAGQNVSNTPAILPANTTVFFPGGNGVTYSCTGGPPFVYDPGSMGNCTVQQIGPPAGLICDVPTTIIIMHDMHQFVADGSRCYSITGDASRPPPGANLPQAQAYPPGTELAPYSPAT